MFSISLEHWSFQEIKKRHKMVALSDISAEVAYKLQTKVIVSLSFTTFLSSNTAWNADFLSSPLHWNLYL